MSQWIDIGPVDDFPDGDKRCVQAGDRSVVVVRAMGQLRAVLNVCPHAGLPLEDGEVRGLTITCPYHGYTYRLTDGCDVDDPDFSDPATMFDVREVDGRVQIHMPEDA